LITSKTEILNMPLPRAEVPAACGEIVPTEAFAPRNLPKPSGRSGISSISGVRPGKRILLYSWLSALVAIAVLAFAFQGKATRFYGLATSTQQSISFEYPVEILRIPVVDGEAIDKNQLLVEVRRHDLTSEIEIVKDRILHIVDLRDASISESSAELERLKAQQSGTLAELDSKIAQLETQQELNSRQVKLLLGEAGSISTASSAPNPVAIELEGLRKQRKFAAQATQARIDNLEQQLYETSHPSDAEISALEKRRFELERQSRDLYVGAQFAGSIGSVYYKPGEKVPPFQSVLSLQSTSPEFIKGYIHEDVQNDVKVGQTVWIQSLGTAEDDPYTLGIVESLGKRMIEYPQRLQKNALITAWGREVMVRLNNESPLLLDEKVVVMLEKPDTVKTLLRDLVTPVSAAIRGINADRHSGPHPQADSEQAPWSADAGTPDSAPDLI